MLPPKKNEFKDHELALYFSSLEKTAEDNARSTPLHHSWLQIEAKFFRLRPEQQEAVLKAIEAVLASASVDGSDNKKNAKRSVRIENPLPDLLNLNSK